VVLDWVRVQFIKWTPSFHTNAPVSSAPIWIGFPGLNLHLLHLNALLSLTYQIGNPIFVDPRMLRGYHPSYLWVCVEIDMLTPRLDFVYILNGALKAKQRVVYERLPLFYSYCSQFGHFLLCFSAHVPSGNPSVEGGFDSNASEAPFQVAKSQAFGDDPSDEGVIACPPEEDFLPLPPIVDKPILQSPNSPTWLPAETLGIAHDTSAPHAFKLHRRRRHCRIKHLPRPGNQVWKSPHR
jgi:hypothetical protein